MAINVGHNDGNYQVSDLANEVTKHIPGATLAINPDGLPDPRSYQVDFTLFESLAPQFKPVVTLSDSIKRLISGLSAIDYDRTSFRNSNLMRLNVLREHISHEKLSDDLRWIQP